jgi:quercetin dioxygenase-like cupin family protein
MPSHSDAQARRVVTGTTPEGRSAIVSDERVRSRLETPGNTKCDIWRVESLPAHVDDGDGLEVGVVTSPADGGLVYRVVTVPADSEWDMSLGYQDKNGPLAGMVVDTAGGGIPGLHYTDTLDIVTILSGELWVALQTGEALLRKGDTLVQRGTKHAWNNRSNQPATIVALMASAWR